MKCYLHIGTEKTGTTSIQSFFSKNRNQLALRDYHYLKSLGLPHNRRLSLIAYNAKRRDGTTKRLGLFSDQELIDYQKEIIKKIKDELEELPPNSTIVCSNEHVQSRLITIEEINKLKDILNNLGLIDIKIIIYLRNPPEIANSLFSTAIKNGSTLMAVPPPDNQYFDNICNHKKTIEKFSSVFGEKNLIVRLFRRDKFHKQSLIHDISKIVGIDKFMNDLTIPENKNDSLSLIGIKILRNLNKTIPLFKSNKINDERKDLVAFIAKHFSTPKFVMDEQLYSAYDSAYSKSNQWIKENYFPEETELFPFKRPKANQSAISDEELKNITDFITEIWIRGVKPNDEE